MCFLLLENKHDKPVSFLFALAGTNSQPNALLKCYLLNSDTWSTPPFIPSMISALFHSYKTCFTWPPQVHSVGKAQIEVILLLYFPLYLPVHLSVGWCCLSICEIGWDLTGT